MTETLDVIARRFACRAFTDEPVPHDTLRAIAEAGLHAPSALNRQPWRMVIVADKDVLDDLGAVGLELLRRADPSGHERIMGRGGKLMYNAPAMIVLAEQPQQGAFSADLDLGILASHVSLAATALGVDNCIAALPALALRGPDGAKRARAIGVPDGFEAVLVVLLGHAASAGTPHEPDPAKIIG